MNKSLVVLGAFPPPVHGMAAINRALADQLIKEGFDLIEIDISANSIARDWFARWQRAPKALWGALKLLLVSRAKVNTLYMSVSGGAGQVYELLILLVARLKGFRVFMHHHSFAYIDNHKGLTALLCRVAGTKGVHVLLSARMADRLAENYAVGDLRVLSNTVFLADGIKHRPVRTRNSVRRIGFLSNISREKGVIEFVELMEQIQNKDLSIEGVLAGPFESEQLEQEILNRIGDGVVYEGAKYGEAKQQFFDSIDVFIFPTIYANEAEPIVVYEALSCGVPVIAYGRGAIPEVLTPECGLVIDPSQPFANPAYEKLLEWSEHPSRLASASTCAQERFTQLAEENRDRWEALKRELMD